MKKQFVLQGLTTDCHQELVVQVLNLDSLDRAIISVAFANAGGVQQIEDELSALGASTTIYAGIRNGVTTAQGLLSLMECGNEVFVVDTGTNSTIFHPKLYLSYSGTAAKFLLGSANLTVGGLSRNIEASMMATLDLAEADDRDFLNEIVSKIDAMTADFPKHVYKIQTEEDVLRLFEAGLVKDETIKTPRVSIGKSHKRDLDQLPKIEFKSKLISRKRAPAKLALEVVEEAIAKENNGQRTFSGNYQLVWLSKPLSRRDLGIPKEGSNTSPTGSMLFSKGEFLDIDQRHYFREKVFSNLNWVNDTSPTRSHLERAETFFQFQIKGVSHGTIKLKLSHDSRTDSPTYRQGNSVTQIHWGDAGKLVRKTDLLGCQLRLYRDNENTKLFFVEIN